MASCRATSTCCARADRSRREELGAMVGVDLADPGFWDRGLDIIERRLEATIEAAERGREAGVTVPRHPVEHRQRRPARAALHRAPSRPRARRPVGALARQGRARRGRAGRPRAQRRARDQRRRRAARARRRLRLLHRDRRPAPERGDQRHGAHPRVGQERRVELGRVADLPAARRRRACASRSKTRAAPGNVVVLHVGHRSRVGERPAAVRAHRRVRVHRRSCA